MSAATVIVRSVTAKIDRMITRQQAKKMTLVGRSVAQRVAEQAAHSRRGSAVLKGLRAAGSALGSVMHQLWLEVTGFVFLSIAAVGAFEGFREYGKYHAGLEPGPGRLILAVCFTISFAWFGLSSFVRVRAKKKS
jgi:hypothetical protein